MSHYSRPEVRRGLRVGHERDIAPSFPGMSIANGQGGRDTMERYLFRHEENPHVLPYTELSGFGEEASHHDCCPSFFHGIDEGP